MIAHDITTIRARIHDRLAALSVADAIEPYNPALYIRNASIGENILFGWPTDQTLTGASLAQHGFAISVFERTGLNAPLLEIGRRIAATMLEIFEGLPADHVLFEQFAFFSAEEFPGYRELLARWSQGQTIEADRARLMGLAMLYCEPRHRLGLIDETLERNIVATRAIVRREAPASLRELVAFYNPQEFCEAAPLRDNLLFGAIAPGAATAQERILGALRDALSELGLERNILSLGLDHQAGYAGRALFPSARAAIVLARNLIRQPQILVLNDALGPFGEVEAAEILARVKREMAGRTVVITGRSPLRASGFDIEVAFEGARIRAVTQVGSGKTLDVEQVQAPSATGPSESEELAALRAVALFAGIDTPRLRLLAFTSMRVNFGAGETLFSEGEASDAAYVLISGSADVLIASPDGTIVASRLEANAIIGEMGIVTGNPRSATIVAQSHVTALRLQKEVFLALLAEFPQMALSVTRLIVSRLQSNLDKINGGTR